MIITILSIGKIKNKSILNLFNDFKKRISRFQRIKIIEIKDSTQEKESKQLIEYFNSHKEQQIYLLDERGKIYTSKLFSEMLKQDEEDSKDITFIIAGADGPTNEVKSLIKNHLALSTMTLTHEMAKLLLIEQIYRSITIWKNIPYHKTKFKINGSVPNGHFFYTTKNFTLLRKDLFLLRCKIITSNC